MKINLAVVGGVFMVGSESKWLPNLCVNNYTL